MKSILASVKQVCKSHYSMLPFLQVIPCTSIGNFHWWITTFCITLLLPQIETWTLSWGDIPNKKNKNKESKRRKRKRAGWRLTWISVSLGSKYFIKWTSSVIKHVLWTVHSLFAGTRDVGRYSVFTVHDHCEGLAVICFLEGRLATHQHEQNHTQTPDIWGGKSRETY